MTCAWPDDYQDVLRYQWEDVLVPYWQEAAGIARKNGVQRIALASGALEELSKPYLVGSGPAQAGREAGVLRSRGLDVSFTYLPQGDGAEETPGELEALLDTLGVLLAALSRRADAGIAFAEARARCGKGGPFLFGTFGAVDIFYAPVVSRFITYGIGVPGFATAYMQAVWEHDWLQQWLQGAEDEEWTIEQFEVQPA